MSTVPGIVATVFIVTVDNALLAGLLLPSDVRPERRKPVLAFVGALVGGAQVILASSIDRLLRHVMFRWIAIVSLGWMGIRMLEPRGMRRDQSWEAVPRLFFFTVCGNLDNMIWLGAKLRGDRLWLVLATVAAIPLFVAAALFLSSQAEKRQWVLPLGAGMMVWVAASLALDTPALQRFVERAAGVPRTTIQGLVTAGILGIGFGLRRLTARKRRSRN